MTKKLDLTTIIYLVILFLLTHSCVKKDKGFKLYRFIDHLEAKNIISSPLINLEKKLNRIKQEWSGDEFSPLKMEQIDYLGISSHFPILGRNEAKKPAGMKLLKDGEEINFSEKPLPHSFTWRWKKVEEEIVLQKLYPTKKKTKGIVLYDTEFIDTEVILPQGIVIFDILASSENSDEHCLRLDVSLNGQKIGTLAVKSNKSYRIVREVSLGKHNLRLSFNNSISGFKKKALFLQKIKIKALKDILLVSPPSGKKLEREGTYQATYWSEPVDTIRFPEHPSDSPQSFQTDVFFDTSGKKQIEVIAQSTHLNSPMSLWLDDRKIGTQQIDSLEWSSIIFEPSVPKGQSKLRIEGEFLLYAVILENPLKDTILPIYEFKDEAEIHDLGIGKNPYLIKKKLVIRDNAYGRSINTIFAPPQSTLEFKLKLSDSSILEFGYGLLNRAWKERGDGVNFVVLIEEGGEKKVLFSKYLNPYRKKNQRKVFQEKIDLSDYKRKRVKLSFITTGFPPDRKSSRRHPDMRNDLSFWYNPVIFEQSEAGINIILISIDTLRADHLGCYGYERKTSPNVDQLAEDGVLFLNTFCDSPWTLPSHVSMLTSLNALHHGVNSLGYRMPSSMISLADLLRQNNFFCSALTGGAKVSAKFGFSKGFDSYGESKAVIYQQDSAEVLFKKTARWIDQNKNKDFFLFLHTYQVHGPYNPPPPYDQMFSKRKIDDKFKFLREVLGTMRNKYSPLDEEDREEIISLYDGEIRYTDEYLIGSLITKLKEMNLYDKSMIIFTSDHGEEFYEHQGWEHSHSLYNEMIQTPLIIKFPHSSFKGKKIDSIVRLIDIVPSVLEVLEIEFSDLDLDGKSLIRVINGKEKGDRTFLSYLGPEGCPHVPEKISMNNDKYKLILNYSFSEEDLSFFIPPPTPPARLELFHLEKDPAEGENLSHLKRNITQLLIRQLNMLLSENKQRRDQQKAIIDEELEDRLRALGYIK